MDLIRELSNSLQSGEAETVAELTARAIEQGVDT